MRCWNAGGRGTAEFPRSLCLTPLPAYQLAELLPPPPRAGNVCYRNGLSQPGPRTALGAAVVTASTPALLKRGEGAASRPSFLCVPAKCVCLGVHGADGTNRVLIRCAGLKLVWTE